MEIKLEFMKQDNLNLRQQVNILERQQSSQKSSFKKEEERTHVFIEGS